MSVKAGTPDEDYNAIQAEVRAANAEMNKTGDFLKAHGLIASVPQLKNAIAQGKSLVERQRAILQRGIDQCVADPEYNKTHGHFWAQLSGLLDKTQQELDQLDAMIKKKLAAKYVF
jgi:hypothetical protein